MKKLSILAVALMFVMVGAAMAGDYHSGTTLACQDCHVMHYSQTHGYNANGGGITVALAGGPHDYLLRQEVNDLCLQCHDNQTFAPDVLMANGGGSVTNGRQAGALNRGNVAPYYSATGHTLDATAVAPGGTWSNPDGLNCVNCHTQHGRTGAGGVSIYRNANIFLNGTPATPFMTYAIGTNVLTRDVFELSSAFGGDHYDIQNVQFNEPSATASGYAQWCQLCHTDFHGSQASLNMRNQAGPAQQEWYRHPTADANIGFVGGGHSSLSRFTSKPYRVHVMSSTGAWGPWGAAWTGAPTDLTPSCMSCHKGHGSQNAFGLIFATGAANYGENGDGSNYKVVCGQCHVQVPAAPPY